MSQRTFHHRLTLGSLCGLVLFSLLVIYLFWIKQALLGLFVVIVIVGMIERILHTTYTFIRIKPFDRDEEMEFCSSIEAAFRQNNKLLYAML